MTIAGFPLEGLLAGLSVTGGNVSRLSGLGGDTGQLQISAPVQPGNSGGPALDAAGNVIGVVVAKLDALVVARATGDVPQNVNFAIKAGVLRALLDAHGVAYSPSSGGRPLAADAIAARAAVHGADPVRDVSDRVQRGRRAAAPHLFSCLVGTVCSSTAA